ncbi:MAG TPA: glycoside hydrolase family 172 protein [Planctomycetota bacterium]|nr:glycoside hydrolase family 172 protein [Planctomycetota bacterium]
MTPVVRTVLGLLALASAARGQQAPSLDFPVLLQRLVDVDWLWQPPLAGERCVQFSSYDRQSDAGPGDATKWYANDDRGHYLRTVDTPAGAEHVMVDAAGPGCVARIWSANPSGVLHFDVDGARVWSVDFARLCSGTLEGVPEPLAGMRAKGGNCHLPIPFAEHLVVSATAADLYYHADVVTFPAGTAVPGFSPDVLATHRAAIAACCERLRAPEPMLSGAHAPPACWRVEVPPGRVVRELLVHVTHRPAEADLGAAMRGVLLVVRCGGEETVRVPVGDFFGVGGSSTVHRGTRLGFFGSGYCRFPMPMPRGGEIELVADDGVPAGARLPQLRLSVLHEAATFAPEPLLFRASFHLAKGTPTRPFADHLVLDARGIGRFVGTSLLVRNPSRIWWGEGDEKFTVDGEAFPSWFGTGTEDYFGYAWCCPEPFQSPLHAQVQCDGPMNYGYTVLHRTHLLDSVPFRRSFRFELERWHWTCDIEVDYRTVAYWYGAAGATAGLPVVPGAAERALLPLPPPPQFAAAGAIEGEDLRVVSLSGGLCEIQNLAVVENTFSRDAHVWWRDGEPGDVLVLAVPVAEAARYRVVAAFTRAADFGRVQVSLGGQRFDGVIDGYAERIGSTGPRELGVVSLPAGEAQLRLELVGRNPHAKPRHMVGLDYVRLEKLP